MQKDFDKIMELQKRFPQAIDQIKQAWQRFMEVYPIDRLYSDVEKDLYAQANQLAICDKCHEHYAIYTNGTVVDIRTKLMWKRCSEGQTWDGTTCRGNANEKKWEEIMPGGKQKPWPKFAGYDDWRVPSVDELKTLVYCSSGKPKMWNDIGSKCGGGYQYPTIDITAFPNTSSASFWTNKRISNSIYIIRFSSGDVYYIENSFDSYAVRLVRGPVA